MINWKSYKTNFNRTLNLLNIFFKVGYSTHFTDASDTTGLPPRWISNLTASYLFLNCVSNIMENLLT